MSEAKAKTGTREATAAAAGAIGGKGKAIGIRKTLLRSKKAAERERGRMLAAVFPS